MIHFEFDWHLWFWLSPASRLNSHLSKLFIFYFWKTKKKLHDEYCRKYLIDIFYDKFVLQNGNVFKSITVKLPVNRKKSMEEYFCSHVIRNQKKQVPWKSKKGFITKNYLDKIKGRENMKRVTRSFNFKFKKKNK